MSKVSGSAAATILTVALSLSLISVAHAEQYNNAAANLHRSNLHKSTSTAGSTARCKAASAHHLFDAAPNEGAYGAGYAAPYFRPPLQDPLDAWDGYFGNPIDNPNYHGSNGG